MRPKSNPVIHECRRALIRANEEARLIEDMQLRYKRQYTINNVFRYLRLWAV